MAGLSNSRHQGGRGWPLAHGEHTGGLGLACQVLQSEVPLPSAFPHGFQNCASRGVRSEQAVGVPEWATPGPAAVWGAGPGLCR